MLPQFCAVDIVKGARIVTARVNGRTHQIPEVWLMGFCRGGRHPEEAVAQWDAQAQMEAAWEAEHTCRDEGYSPITGKACRGCIGQINRNGAKRAGRKSLTVEGR
jgi:hypothetical protein